MLWSLAPLLQELRVPNFGQVANEITPVHWLAMSMTVESVTSVVLALTSVCTLFLAIVVYMRGASTRRHAERAANAAQLLEAMTALELAGMDVGVDEPAARALHDTQLRELRQVIRVSARGFTDKARHPGIPAYLLIYGVCVGVLLTFCGMQLAPTASQVRVAEQWVAWLIVVAVVLIGFGLTASSFLALWMKWAARERQRAAGIKVPTVGAEIRENVNLIRSAVRRRRATRRERKAARSELRRVA